MQTDSPAEALYRALLESWNHRDPKRFAGQFAPDGSMVGFDGSGISSATSIEEHLASIFDDHEPARYVAVVREVRPLGSSAVLLRAEAGMVPPGEQDLMPERNTVHALVAVEVEGEWRAAHFHSTPAAFDGRPEAVDALTAELRGQLPPA
jgi:uncharacterized protein (TIGR02246 family)